MPQHFAMNALNITGCRLPKLPKTTNPRSARQRKKMHKRLTTPTGDFVQVHLSAHTIERMRSLIQKGA